MKNLMMFSLMMFVSVFAFAQKGGANIEAKVQKKVDRMTEQLNLTADQQTRMTDLFTKQYENRNAKVKKGKELSQEERSALKAERKAAREKTNADIAEILTPEQLATYKSHPSKGKKGKKAKKGKGEKLNKAKEGKKLNKANKKTPAEKADRKVAKLTEELNLTPTQQEQLKELMVSRAPAKSHNKKEMTKEERMSMKEESKTQRESFQTKLEAILTAEQLATYNKLQEERKGKKKGKKNKEMKKQDRTIEK